MNNNNPVSGAIEGIAIDPTSDDIIYAAAVNGGVWKTTNGTANDPVWSPLTDQALSAISMASIALDPGNSNIIYAGTGSVSSFGDGNPGIGVAKSTDSGATWSTLAGGTFAGQVIVSIVPIGGSVVLACTPFGGVYRSTDGASTFTLISGGAGTNLPAGGCSSVIVDPSLSSRLYAGIPSLGIYISTDSGQTWTQVNTGLTGIPAGRILLAGQSTGNAFAMVINGVGTLSDVFRTTNQGGTWANNGQTAPSIYPGGQGGVHGAIVAHPTNGNIVYVSGDRQAFPFTNGCTDFVLNAFRGSFAGGGSWADSIVCNGATNGGSPTAPHADSRVMRFNAANDLLLGCDGGIYRLRNGNSGTAANRDWRDVNGNITPTEFHSIAYDSNSNFVFGGAQDTGVPHQIGPGTLFREVLSADGGNVGVDTDQTAHPGTSLRYSSTQFFGRNTASTAGDFQRQSFNAAGNFGAVTTVGLNITAGSGTGQNLYQFDTGIQFYQPFAINRITQARVLIATSSIYESTNNGDSLNNLGNQGLGGATCLTYGGRLNGVDEPNAFYVGFGGGIVHRVSGSITTLSSYPGIGVLACAMDLQDYRRIFVVDFSKHVWASLDEGVTWINITGNLPLSTSRVLSIESFRPTADTNGTRAFLIVGTDHGAWRMYRPGTGMAPWAQTGVLPNTLLFDTHYDYTDDVLVAGMLGRGAWTLGGYFGNNPLPTK